MIFRNLSMLILHLLFARGKYLNNISKADIKIAYHLVLLVKSVSFENLLYMYDCFYVLLPDIRLYDIELNRLRKNRLTSKRIHRNKADQYIDRNCTESHTWDKHDNRIQSVRAITLVRIRLRWAFSLYWFSFYFKATVSTCLLGGRCLSNDFVGSGQECELSTPIVIVCWLLWA